MLAWLKGMPKEWLFAASFEHFTDAEKVTVRREFIAIILTRLIVLFFCADLGRHFIDATGRAVNR
jgi:hypothetical protein